MNALVFQGTSLHPITQNGELWLTSRELGQALGYAREDAVNKIYERNADEFNSSMTCNVKKTLQGQRRQVRIFSLRGCHLIAMFARTPVAKEFRKWVLDVLDREVSKVPAGPVVDKYMLNTIEHLCLHATYLRAFWHQYSSAIRGMNNSLAGGLHDHFVDASCAALSLQSSLKLDLPKAEQVLHFPFAGDHLQKMEYTKSYS